MKEKAVVKDWDNNHLGKRRFGRERGQAWVFFKLGKVIKLFLLDAHTFKQHTEGKRC